MTRSNVTTRANEVAFPFCPVDRVNTLVSDRGLTTREFLAAFILAGLQLQTGVTRDQRAAEAVRSADALVRALNAIPVDG